MHRYKLTCSTPVCVFTVVSAYREVMHTSLTCCRSLILSPLGCVAPGGMRQTQKGIITFLPKHRNWMNYLRYTRQAPRQLRDWTTLILLGNLEARGQSRNLWEVGWGIPGEAEVTSEGKLNDKKQKGGVGSGGMEHTFKLWFVQCVYIHAAIYHRYHTHTASHTDIST